MEKSITSPTRHSWKIITRFSRTIRYISSKNKQMNLTRSHPYCLSSQLPRWFICVVTKVLLKHIPKHLAVCDKIYYCNLAKELLHDLMNTLATRNSTFWKNAWNTVHNFTPISISTKVHNNIHRILYFETFLTKKILYSRHGAFMQQQQPEKEW